jgi:hypothetical protein
LIVESMSGSEGFTDEIHHIIKTIRYILGQH